MDEQLTRRRRLEKKKEDAIGSEQSNRQLEEKLSFLWKLLPYISLGLLLFLIYSLLILVDLQQTVRLQAVCPTTNSSNLTVRNPQDFPVVFVGGVPGSGTTLMQAIIDAHPDVRCGNNTPGMEKLILTHASLLKHDIFADRIYNAKIPTEIIDRSLAGYLVEIFTAKRGKHKLYCDKSKNALIQSLYLNLLFKNSKFIAVIRDGRAAAYSAAMRNASKGTDMGKFTPEEFVLALHEWSRGTEQISRSCYIIGPERCLPVFYENLVQDPEKVLRQVFSFLKLPWNDRVLQHYKYVRPALQHNASSPVEIKQPITTDFLKKFVNKIPAELKNADDLLKVAPMMKTLGYDTSPNPDYNNLEFPAEKSSD